MISDSQSFFQLIKLRAHFNNETCITKINQMNEQVLLMMKNVPKEMYHTVSKYIDLAQMVSVHWWNNQQTNWTHKEHIAMEELAKRKDLIITHTDKGGAVVIMDTDSNIKEANEQLSDKASHKQSTQDIKLQHNRMVNQTTERFKNE